MIKLSIEKTVYITHSKSPRHFKFRSSKKRLEAKLSSPANICDDSISTPLGEDLADEPETLVENESQ